MIKAVGIDLGTAGAIFRAKLENGVITPLSCNRWMWDMEEEKRYYQFTQEARCELDWADAMAYEYVQFNRGKSIIAGLRGILLAAAEEHEILCHGVNVSTLKSFAIPQIKGKKKDRGKGAMAQVLAIEWPEFYEHIAKLSGKVDDLVDAAWTVIWLLENIEEGGFDE